MPRPFLLNSDLPDFDSGTPSPQGQEGINFMSDEIRKFNISVRDIVEFILRGGDIDSRSTHADPDAMQAGSRLHRKIQKRQPADYRAEVALSFDAEEEYDGEKMIISIDGRADGIFISSEPESIYFIDEIKTTYGDIFRMDEPVAVHKAQAKCYAYIYALQEGLADVGVQMTYCNIDTEQIKQFKEVFQFGTLKEWFDSLTHEYAKWMAWQIKWGRARNESVKKVEFPFSYRHGQRDLVAGVYRTIMREKKLFLEAPTGVGKTISTVFPAVRAMGEEKASKIFYGTAKTIARTVAEEAFHMLVNKGMRLKIATITAKDKICVLEKPSCNPVDCPRARGHFDRVNDCVYDMLTHEEEINRGLIEKYAEKYNVCPFEMGLDVTTWSDAIICDYNYLFDPNVYLHRFFADGRKHDYVFLIDEAHNLVERAREMYSAVLIKEKFLAVKRMVGVTDASHKRLSNALERCNKSLLEIKRQCEDFAVWEDADSLYGSLVNFMGVYEGLPRQFTAADPEMLSELYLEVRHFVNMYEGMDEEYCIYSDYQNGGDFYLHLQCMDPSRLLKQCFAKGKSATLFSATLLPIRYYIEQLGGNADTDYAVYAPSPFSKENRIIMVARDVSTKYTRRSGSEYLKIAGYIKNFVEAKKGNYMVFFPSYRMLKDISEVLGNLYVQDGGELESFSTGNGTPEDNGSRNGKTILALQLQNMTEEEKEAFLEFFDAEGPETRIGFCVMGGIFGEGIDLRADRLIGAVIVGTGLPQVCNERELFRNYFDEKCGTGFEYAYLYNGMNKVLQSAGRVIRTDDDRGAILLLDERFGTKQYSDLFPQEWYPYEYVTAGNMKERLAEFWKSCGKENGKEGL